MHNGVKVEVWRMRPPIFAQIRCLAPHQRIRIDLRPASVYLPCAAIWPKCGKNVLLCPTSEERVCMRSCTPSEEECEAVPLDAAFHQVRKPTAQHQVRIPTAQHQVRIPTAQRKDQMHPEKSKSTGNSGERRKGRTIESRAKETVTRQDQ
jgi:hypothetical protein